MAMHRCIVVVAILALAVIASGAAAASTPQARSARLHLPEYIGVLEYLGERSPTNERIDASHSYRAVGLALDIDVYDGGASQTGGAEPPALTELYEQVKRGFGAQAASGARLLREGAVRLGESTGIPAREAVFSTGKSTSYLWVADVHGWLVQMRFDVQTGLEEEGDVSRSEILAALGEPLARLGAVADVPDGTREVSVAIVWDPSTPPAEHRLWMTYLLTRAAHAAKESELRWLPLGEREASFDEELRARTVAVSVYRSLSGAATPLASPYFHDLERIDAAGFLREYVWRYLHRPSWSAPPAGLDLRAFDAWRAEHLSGHVAVTHGHIDLRLATR